MNSTISEQLRARFKSPREALLRLGFDSATIESILSQARGKTSKTSDVRRVFAMTPALKLAYDAAGGENGEPGRMNATAIMRLTEFLKDKLDETAMTELQNLLATWAADHREDVNGERKTALDDIDLGAEPKNYMQTRGGPAARFADAVDPEQRAAAAMDARLRALEGDSVFDKATRRLAKKFPGVESITAGWSRD